MSAKRWALSVFFVWHVVSTVLGSLDPSNVVLQPVGPPRHPENDPLAATLTPALDRAAAVAAAFPETLTRVARPLRGMFGAYLEITGLSQNWKMFSAPPEVHQYLRVRYYVGPRGDVLQTVANPAWTATELVLPAHREDEVRLFRGYRDSFRDKAMTTALQRFQRNRDANLLRPDTSSTELPSDLAPIGRYFARRFERDVLQPDERVLRTEIWYGVAPMPPPGATLDRPVTEARLSVLRGYYEGPVQDHFGRPVYPGYHSTEGEADIFWVLEYFEP